MLWSTVSKAFFKANLRAQTKITSFNLFSYCHLSHWELNATDLSLIVGPSLLCVTVITIITYKRYYLYHM